jgi:hypothetical protein
MVYKIPYRCYIPYGSYIPYGCYINGIYLNDGINLIASLYPIDVIYLIDGINLIILRRIFVLWLTLTYLFYIHILYTQKGVYIIFQYKISRSV